MQKVCKSRMPTSKSPVNSDPRKPTRRRTTAEIETEYCNNLGESHKLNCSFHGLSCPRQQRSFRQRLVWRCVRPKLDALDLQLSFVDCKKCSEGKEYNTASNAASHFKRCHLRLKTDVRRSTAQPKGTMEASVAPSAAALGNLGYLKRFTVPNPDYDADTDEHDPSELLRRSEIPAVDVDDPRKYLSENRGPISDPRIPNVQQWATEKVSKHCPDPWMSGPQVPDWLIEKWFTTEDPGWSNQPLTTDHIDPRLLLLRPTADGLLCDDDATSLIGQDSSKWATDGGCDSSLIPTNAQLFPTTKTHGAPAHYDTSSMTVESGPCLAPRNMATIQDSPWIPGSIETDGNAVLLSSRVAEDQACHDSTKCLESAAPANSWDARESVDVTDCQNTPQNSLHLADSPHYSFETLSVTPDSASQQHKRRNPFVRRLRSLVKHIASEEASDYSINYESDTDSDNASIFDEDPESHGDDQYDDDTPNSNTPGSSSSRGTGGHRPSADTTQGSSRQAGGSSRTNIGPINVHEDSARVQTDTSGTPNNQAIGTVIRCPISAELECAGKDDNMSSLLRELSNNAHNIFYCNTCKSLLSRIPPIENATTEDKRRLRFAHNENKSQWLAHTRACHEYHCAMRACAPNPDGDLRHKHNANCQIKREEEKQADVDYLYHVLGIAQQDVQLGIKTDHKGKRKSCVKKAVEIATEAAQRNAEAESELRDCREENEKLKETNHTQCRRIEELEADKEKLAADQDELYSILRHALEDIERDRGAVTHALHDRIKRHAPSVLEKYRVGSKAAVSTAPARQDALRTPSSLSQESVDSTNQASSSLASPAKRRRVDRSTSDGVSTISSPVSQPGFYTPFNDGIDQRSTASRPGTSPFVPDSRHDSVAFDFQDNMMLRDGLSWERKPQHITNSTMHQGTIDPFSTFTGLPSASIENGSSSQEQPGSPIDFGLDDPNANTFDFPTNNDGFNQMSADHYGQGGGGGGLPGAQST